MTRLSYREMASMFYEYNAEHRGAKPLRGRIVFTPESFGWVGLTMSDYERTYCVSSENKAWIPGMGGYSIFGHSLDGVDRCVRLDLYMQAERGGEKGWVVDYCYIVDEEDN